MLHVWCRSSLRTPLPPLSQLLNSRNGSKFKTICWPQTEQLRNQFNPHSVQTQTFTLVSLTKFMLEKCQTRFSNQTDNKQKSELPNRMVSFGFIVRFSVLSSQHWKLWTKEFVALLLVSITSRTVSTLISLRFQSKLFLHALITV